MRIVTAQVMQTIDSQTINGSGIPGIQLMERAGQSCVDEIYAEFGIKGRAVVMAGKGNNGGDGYVIARLLSYKGWKVKVIILADQGQISGDAAINLAKLNASTVTYCTDEGQLSALHTQEIFQADLIVDALFGTGLSKPVSGVYLGAIDLMNASGKAILSVDIPSGIDGSSGQTMGSAVMASTTVTFAFPKLGHLFYPGTMHTGRLVTADIGIPPDVMASAAGYDFLDPDTVRPLVHIRNRLSHKGTFGHCLIIAASTGKTGAAALCANSSVRSGSGLVTLAVPQTLHSILEVKTTEVMTVPLVDSRNSCLIANAYPAIEKLLSGKDVLAIGPGLGRHPGTFNLVRKLLERVSLPMVIDADALNALAEDVSSLKRKKTENLVLTPHPGEMSRLISAPLPELEALRIPVAQTFARKYAVFLILKGTRTIIASPDGAIAINGSGNPGMASGGMGDVLTGIIASLIGQGYAVWDACRLGVFLHGFAADMVAEEKGEIGINATDVIERLPYAYNKLLQKKPLSKLVDVR